MYILSLFYYKGTSMCHHKGTFTLCIEKHYLYLCVSIYSMKNSNS